MAKKTFTTPQMQPICGYTQFRKTEDELTQYLNFKPDKRQSDNEFKNIDVPLGKALKGSITYAVNPNFKDGKHIAQTIRVYKKSTVKRSATILETRYSRVNVSRSRVTVTFSFPLCDDPTRLKARLQNFGNIIIDESDEIAAMLNQEGDTKVSEAWQTIEQFNQKGGNDE